MASLKPQPLPYTKRGIFGAPVGQGFTGIGARVGKSVSSMWSSVASSLLTRGLGYGEEPTKTSGLAQKSSGPLSMPLVTKASSLSGGAGTNISAGVIPATPPPIPADGTEIAKMGRVDRVATDAQTANEKKQHPPTLIENELETLSGDFEKRRRVAQSDTEARDLGTGIIKGSPEWAEAEERGRRLRKEEGKVRQLNRKCRFMKPIMDSHADCVLQKLVESTSRSRRALSTST